MAYLLPLFLAFLLPFFLACQEAQEEDIVNPPPQGGGPPFPRSAPELTLTNHEAGWNRADCTTCHLVHLVKGHTGFGGESCRRCHGGNGTKPDGCADCHNVPNPQGFPLTGLHELHAGQKGYGCGECHANNIHRNGGLNIALARKGEFFYSSPVSGTAGFDGPGCTESGCHEPRRWAKGACDSCHQSPPETGLHRLHLDVLGFGERGALSCRDCHLNNQHDADTTSGAIEVGGAGWTNWTAFKGTCETLCHEGKEQTWDCTSCHGYPPKTGRHETHAVKYLIECQVCHANHEHSFAAAIDPKNPQAYVQIDLLFKRGTWERVTATCADVGCHPDRTWR